MSEGDDIAIALRNVGRDFGERAALRDVSVTLPRGSTLAVFGPNGSGKSTLLRILAGLLAAHAGAVRVLGRELPREAWTVRGRIGFIGHDPLLYRDLSGRENLRYHAGLHGVREGRVSELLERVGIAGRADEPVRTLSRGMVQRLEVCRVVLHGPDLLLLDEPLTGLDPAAADAAEPLIGSSSGLTRVVTSNDPARALEQADVVLGLRAGRAVLEAPAKDVDRERVEALYR